MIAKAAEVAEALLPPLTGHWGGLEWHWEAYDLQASYNNTAGSGLPKTSSAPSGGSGGAG
jgi:hypothetical protein